jgi:hypothetical protein
MLVCNRLRIDPCDGTPVIDYRIENGWVESRTLETGTERGTAADQQWHRLTPEELSSHVMADTVVARWLRGRMGIYGLIRACTERIAA